MFYYLYKMLSMSRLLLCTYICISYDEFYALHKKIHCVFCHIIVIVLIHIFRVCSKTRSGKYKNYFM